MIAAFGTESAEVSSLTGIAPKLERDLAARRLVAPVSLRGFTEFAKNLVKLFIVGGVAFGHR